jgi:DHA1 family multidrug resistance protein-like MFS transporter
MIMMLKKQPNIYILAFTMVVIMLGFGMVMPIFPFYIEEMGAGGLELGLLMASDAISRLIFAPIWGSLSDRAGRKSVLMLGVFGYGLGMVMFGLATRLWMLFLARILSGILSSATSPTTMAYISDSTSEEDRSGGMGVLGAAIFLGMILGPGMGGLLAVRSISLPFFLAAGLCLLSLGLIHFFLPESLTRRARSQSAKPLTRFRTSELKRVLLSPAGILFFFIFLVNTGMMLFYSIFGLYALDKYGYGTQQVGWILTVVGLASVVAQGVLLGFLTKRWGETVVIKFGLASSSIGFIAMLAAHTDLWILLAIGFFGLTIALLTPTITSLISKLKNDEQGMVMGWSNSFTSAGRFVGPIFAGYIYDVHIEYPYLSGAVLFVSGFIISLLWVRPSMFGRHD